MWDKISNKTKNMHYEIIKDMTKDYDHFLYPRYFNANQVRDI